MTGLTPIVSCLMPTADRRSFVPLAVARFLAQDHPSCELVVADDGFDSVADVMPDDARVRYLRLDRKLSLGAKRNLACEAARGDVIVHWDDDDWSAPWRVSYQVATLEREGADVCGLDRVLFYDPRAARAWRYTFPRGARPWVYGATLCYRKALWTVNRFPEVNVGEDTRFVWGARGARVVALADPRCYVGTIHRGNTSPKRTHDPRWEPVAAAEVEALLADACHDYRAALEPAPALAGAR
jgi:glycosyltransferase involved in cell wall biosynthesis